MHKYVYLYLYKIHLDISAHICYNINKIREAENPKPQKGKLNMKISEVLKKRAYSFSEIEDIEVIACNDFYGIALTCTTCNGIPTYDIYTLDKSYRLKLLRSFLGSKESAEYAYNLFMESVRTESEV